MCIHVIGLLCEFRLFCGSIFLNMLKYVIHVHVLVWLNDLSIYLRGYYFFMDILTQRLPKDEEIQQLSFKLTAHLVNKCTSILKCTCMKH